MVTMFVEGEYRELVHCTDGWMLRYQVDRDELDEHEAKPLEYWLPSPKLDHRTYRLAS